MTALETVPLPLPVLNSKENANCQQPYCQFPSSLPPPLFFLKIIHPIDIVITSANIVNFMAFRQLFLCLVINGISSVKDQKTTGV